MTITTAMGVPVIGEDGQRYLLPDARVPLPRRAFRIRELVVMLGLAKSTIHDMIGRGELRAVKIGRGRRKIFLIPSEEVEKLLSPPSRDPEVDEYLRTALPGYASRRRMAQN